MANSPVSASSSPRGLPFLNGAYVAVNAIPRLFLLVDGPYCVGTKAEMQHCHDLTCDLLAPLGMMRIMPTLTAVRTEEVAALVLERTQRVEDRLDRLAAMPEVDAVVLTAFDFAALLGLPLEQIAQAVGRARNKLVAYLPAGSLSGDYLDGYAGVCAALAANIDLAPQGRRERTVAVVGHMMDRLEPDQRGNLRELRRLLGAIGLEVSSVWLSGEPVTALASVADAECIVSLPHARKAAHILATRLGIDCLECELPIGLSATERFLTVIAERMGCLERARACIDEEATSAVRDTERHFHRLLSGKTARIDLDDPHLTAGLAGLCADIAMNVQVGDGSPPHDPPAAVVFSSSGFHEPMAVNRVPFGYPNYLDHPVLERPFLGYVGFRTLVERMAAASLRAEALEKGHV